jgi:predicted kinase
MSPLLGKIIESGKLLGNIINFILSVGRNKSMTNLIIIYILSIFIIGGCIFFITKFFRLNKKNFEVKIVCGISGSGKSTYIKNNFPDATVCSADHFFYKNGQYQFDSKKLSMAHKNCLKKFNGLIQNRKVTQIVIDNTNVSATGVAPYACLAQAYNYHLEIIMLECDVELAIKRNIHGVNRKVIEKQFNRYKNLKKSLPHWWKTTIIKNEM